MSQIPFAITAYILNGIAVLIDKFMITKHFPDPLVYIFYFSVFSLVVLFIIPFVPPPTLIAFIIASIYTLSWISGSYLMFKGLQIGQPSRVIPIIGALVPLTLLIYYGFLQQVLTTPERNAGAALIAGLIILIIPYIKGSIKMNESLFEIFSALFFSTAYIFLRTAYTYGPYLQIFAYSKLILIPIGLFLFLYPKTRAMILTDKNGQKWSFFSAAGGLFIGGQIAGGLSELLITFSISLANPALVNSLQGVQYIFLFIASLFLAKKIPAIYQEKFSSFELSLKLIGILVIALGLYVLAIAQNINL